MFVLPLVICKTKLDAILKNNKCNKDNAFYLIRKMTFVAPVYAESSVLPHIPECVVDEMNIYFFKRDIFLTTTHFEEYLKCHSNTKNGQ